MIINHNISALKTINKLRETNKKDLVYMERLSSGVKIGKASDDAAGLAISEKMRARIRGLNQAQKNIQDGKSLIQTAEGALGEIQDAVQRMRELSVQASAGTLTNEDRKETQKEISQLNRGIKDLVKDTEFNTINLLAVESLDHLEWKHVQTIANANFMDVTTNDEMFIAVNFDGDIVTSLDGESWKKETTLSRVLNNVYWDGNHFFATGERQTVAYSDNGEEWEIGIEGGSHYFFDIAKNGTTYMATGNAGLAYSNDGLNWNYKNPSLNQASGDLISNGVAFIWLQGSELKTSRDGVNWTTHFDFYQSYQAGDNEIAYNGEVYVVASRDGRTFTSSDLTNWTERQTLANNAIDVKWENNQFIATSKGDYRDNQSIISFSKDGINWMSSTIDDDNIESVSSKNDRYVAVGSSGQVYVGSMVTALKTLHLQVGAGADVFKITLPNMKSILDKVSNVNVLTIDNSVKAISVYDQILENVLSERTKFGAYQNALEHIHKNVMNYEENLTVAESRISDADMAKEIMNQTKNSILSQVAQAMWAQANQQPQGVLQLLR